MQRLRHLLQHRYFIKIITTIILIIAIIYTKTINKKSVYNDNDENTFVGKVYKIKKHNDKVIIYIKAKEKIIIYDYNKTPNIFLGDTIRVSGELTISPHNTIPNLFNYQEYLYYQNIFNIIKAEKVKKIANNTSCIYYIKNKISIRIAKINKSSEYIKTFILGDTSDITESILNSYRQNGISHLFSISGMHVSLFAGFLLFFLKRISYNNYYNYTVIILFLVSYAILVGLTPSVLRSIIMYILFAINKMLKLKISKIDIILLVLIIVLMTNPFNIYNISFQYSYLITFFLVLYSNKLKTQKSKLKKVIYTSLICFLASFPICIYHYYETNFLSVILNIIFIPFVSIIVFPLSLISFFIPKISSVLTIFVLVLEKVSLWISSSNFGLISFPKPNLAIIFIYYFLIIIFLSNYKYFYIFPFMFIHKSLIYFDMTFELTLLDVGEGDSLLLKYPNNKANILIDTGGKYFSNYEIINNTTIPYFQSRGINKIDYLILTHGDYDHMGEAINLVNNFKVEKVIFNCGPYNDLEKELIKVLDKKKIKYYSCIKELNIDNNKLYFLQTKEYDNENDNSNVIYTELDGYKFILMGDAGIEKEKDILDKYNISDIDVLKVGHHGSRTSSGKEFISEMNPKYSIISVGKNNRYGHPNKEVLNNLEQSKIYRTDEDGSIMFKIKNNKLKIETCSP